MKKLFLISLLGMIASLSFISCGDDDDDLAKDVDKNIVGEWAMVTYDDYGTNLYMERMNLKANGSFTITDYDAYGQGLFSGGSVSHVEKTEYSGTYTAVSGQLKMIANGKTVTCYYSVNGNSLTLSGSDGAVTYDKMDSDIEEAFNSAEKWYQNHK